MLKLIKKDPDKKQLIEIHNRPYLIEEIKRENKFPAKFQQLLADFFRRIPLRVFRSSLILTQTGLSKANDSMLCDVLLLKLISILSFYNCTDTEHLVQK